MIANLFGSKTRYKLLRLFLTNPNQSFYVREITRKIDEQINSVRRELSNLLSIGVIVSDSSNNRLYYEVNQKFEYYSDLYNLFVKSKKTVTKTATPKVSNKTTKAKTGASIKDAKDTQEKATTMIEDSANTVVTSNVAEKEKSLGNVSLVIFSGVFTLDDRAPVDVLIVGNVTPTGLKNYINNLESSIDEEISYILLDEEDFNYRRKIRDRTTIQMLNSKLVIKVDKNGILNSNAN